MQNCIFISLRLNANSQAFPTCYDKSDGLSHDDFRAVSSAKKIILHRTSSGRQLK